MTKTFSEVRRSVVAQGDAAGPSEPMLPCRYCGQPTPRQTLGALGARCQGCYERYLRLGYSGAQPPELTRQAAWVTEAAAKARLVREGRGLGGQAFAEVAQALDSVASARAVPRGLSEDEVNGLLQEVGGMTTMCDSAPARVSGAA